MSRYCLGTSYHWTHTSPCLCADSSGDDIAEPSSFGDQFDLTSFHSVDATSAALDETDLAGKTGGE